MPLYPTLKMIIQKCESEPVETTNGNNKYNEEDIMSFKSMYDYLYHGIRNQGYLEKLESIFSCGKILAGKHLPLYTHYTDNCNKGEYVSTLNLEKADRLGWETFILYNISLLISPLCDAVETKFVDHTTWCLLQNYNNLKQLYSYQRGECLSKDYISIDMIKAVGVSYNRLCLLGKKGYADRIINDIIALMEKYDISLPIVDPSNFNVILVDTPKITR